MRATSGAKRFAFSVIEILAALVILAIIGAVAIPRWISYRSTARQQAHEEYKMEIDDAVERYYINENEWPANDLADIGADPNYFPNGVPKNPLDGRRYTLNPTTHRAE